MSTNFQDQLMDSVVSSSGDSGIGDSLCSSTNSNYPTNEQWIQLNAKIDNLEKNSILTLKIVQQLLTLIQAKDKKNPPKKHIKKQTFKQTDREPSASDVSMLYHFPDALQQNITDFTNNVDPLTNTSLIDTLLERECLNEDEYEAITAKKVASDAMRLMILKIKERGYTVIKTFLDILIESDEYKWLGKKVIQSAEEMASKHIMGPQCIVCFMKETVYIKDIVDILWTNNIITSEMHGKIAESESVYKYRCKFWDEVLMSINEEAHNRASVLNTLCAALTFKYEYIVKYLKKVNTDRGPFDCCCSRRRSYRPRPGNSFYKSDDEYSTTSKQNLPSNQLLYDLVDNDSQTEFSSMDTSSGNVIDRHSFDQLDQYELIGSNRTNNYVAARNRHKSGDFIPSEEHADIKTAEATSLPFVFEVTAHGADDNRPQYYRGTSNITIQPVNHSSSGETTNQRSSTSDAVVSPDSTVQQIKYIANPSNTHTPMESSCQKTENIPTKKNRANSLEQEGMLADTEDDEGEQLKAKRLNSKTRWRRYGDSSVLRDAIVTAPRKITDNAATKVPTYHMFSRKSKRSKKRQLRRQKSHQESDDTADIPTTPEPMVEDLGMKKPWNPLRDKIPTPKLTPKWDHNQVLRERKMTPYLTVPSRLPGGHELPKCKSDTDFRTEESETVVSSECNYTM